MMNATLCLLALAPLFLQTDAGNVVQPTPVLDKNSTGSVELELDDEEYEVEDEENYDDLGKYEDEIEYEVDEIDPEEYDLADVFKLMDGGELPEHP